MTRAPRVRIPVLVAVLITVLGVALLLAPGRLGQAHQTNLTNAEVTVAGPVVSYRLTVSAHDLAVALGIPTDLVTPLPMRDFSRRRGAIAAYLQGGLLIDSDAGPCAPDEPEFDFVDFPLNLDLVLTFDCGEAIARLKITYLLFFELDESHRALGKLLAGGRRIPFVFDSQATEAAFDLSGADTAGNRFVTFARILILGAEHILIGFDHLLFLFALLIVNARLLDVVKVVTAFTLAHSVTLALAWYGLVDLPGRLVESAIAFSIGFVAVSNLVGRDFSHRWLLAAAFGLVHGLGFYSALGSLGLTGVDAVTTLLAFNLGVEAGQLAIVALAYPLLSWWARQAWYRRSAQAASLLILAVAAWWVIERVFGA